VLLWREKRHHPSNGVIWRLRHSFPLIVSMRLDELSGACCQTWYAGSQRFFQLTFSLLKNRCPPHCSYDFEELHTFGTLGI
jgi:hypothetical protein